MRQTRRRAQKRQAGRARLSCQFRPWHTAPARRRSARTLSIRADVQAVETTASRRDPSKGPTKISANRQCPPRKETRSPSGRCAHRAASIRTYCRPDKREGLKKTRATTSSAFWDADNRRSGACEGSRFHRVREPRETQPSYHRILSILTLYRLSPIILSEQIPDGAIRSMETRVSTSPGVGSVSKKRCRR